MLGAYGYFVRAECRLLFRARGTWILLAVATLLGLLALQQGHQVYETRQLAADSVRNQQVRQQESVLALLRSADTSQTKQRVEEPYFFDYRWAQHAIHTASPLSAWAIGQSDVFPAILSLRFNQPHFAPTQQEFSNPAQLLAGNFDLAYYLLFLFPLLFIAWTYAIPGHDLEQGNYQWLKIYYRPVHFLYALRLAVRWALASMPFHFCLILGTRIMIPAPLDSWAAFAGVSLLYQFFWLVLVWLLLAFRLRTATQTIVLLSTWLVLLFVVPSLTSTTTVASDDFSGQLATTDFRSQSERIWQQPLNEHRRYLSNRYQPQQVAKLPADSNEVKYLSWGLQMMAAEQVLFQQQVQRRQDAYRMESNLLWMNPIAAFYSALTQLAETDLYTQIQFERSVFDNRMAKATFLFEHNAFQPRFRSTDFQRIPVWQKPAPTRLSNVALAVIAGWLMSLGFATWLAHRLIK